MEVILLTDVEKVGLRGDVVDVARGYARNFLLPRRLAEQATPARLAELRRHELARARHEARTLEQGQQVAELLGTTVLRFEMKAGPTGALFGSVTPTDIADELWRARRIRVDRRKIDLAEPIKRVGRYEIPIEVFTDLSVDVKTLVVPEGGELPPEEEAPAGDAEAPAAAVEPPSADVASEAAADRDGDSSESEPVLEASREEAAAQMPDDAFDRSLDPGDDDQS